MCLDCPVYNPTITKCYFFSLPPPPPSVRLESNQDIDRKSKKCE